jgi:hypothetical protein
MMFAALGEYREVGSGRLYRGWEVRSYLKGKVSAGHLPPSVAQLAIAALCRLRSETSDGKTQINSNRHSPFRKKLAMEPSL